MHADHRQDFYTAWSTMIELQAGKELSDRALRLAFDLLADYDLAEVKVALRAHCLKSPYIAKPADIVQIIRGEVPSNAELYGLAQTADTMLGAYVRHAVGAHDVDKLTARDASARVSSVRRQVEAFVERVQAGDVSDHEIQMLGGRGFDVTGELCQGLPGARRMFWEPLRARQAALVHVQLPAKTSKPAEAEPETRSEAEIQAGKQKLAEMMRMLNTTTIGEPA